MLIFAPKETDPNEPRAAVTPDTAARLVKLGATVAVESGIGGGAFYPDATYEKAGAAVRADREAALGEADIVLRVRQPPAAEVALLKQGAIHISFLDPFNESPSWSTAWPPTASARSAWSWCRAPPAPRSWTRSARSTASPATPWC